jgi:hypothetical protein
MTEGWIPAGVYTHESRCGNDAGNEIYREIIKRKRRNTKDRFPLSRE